MAIDFRCGGCQKRFRVSDEFRGKTIRCVECKTPIALPADEFEAEQPVEDWLDGELEESLEETGELPPRTRPKKKPVRKKSQSSDEAAKELTTLSDEKRRRLVVLGVAGGLLFCAVGAGAFFAMSGDEPTEPLVADLADQPNQPDIAQRNNTVRTSGPPPAAVAGRSNVKKDTAKLDGPVDLSAFLPATAGPQEPAVSAAPVKTPEPSPAEPPPQPVVEIETNVAESPTDTGPPTGDAVAESRVAVAELPSKVTTEASPVNVPTSVGSSAVSHADISAALRKACYRCHGENGANEGGLNYVTSLIRLRESLVVPGKPQNSPLIERITSSDESIVMPPADEKPRLTQQEIAAVTAWVQAGASVPDSTEDRKWISNDDLVALASQDLQTMSSRSRRFARYFTLTQLYNAGVSTDELETYRLAFTKLINCLSWNKKLVVPHPVNATRTLLRVDIRDLN